MTPSAAGEVTKVLIALINSDPAAASWRNAVTQTEALVTRMRGKKQIAGSAMTLRSALKEFGPVLHLWAAWNLRGRRFRNDASVGYSFPDDVEMFRLEAQTLLHELREWDGAKNENARSKYLRNVFCEGPDWTEPTRQPNWPETGVIEKFIFAPDLIANPPPLRRRRRKLSDYSRA